MKRPAGKLPTVPLLCLLPSLVLFIVMCVFSYAHACGSHRSSRYDDAADDYFRDGAEVKQAGPAQEASQGQHRLPGADQVRWMNGPVARGA